MNGDKKMKKFWSILLVLVMVISLIACKGQPSNSQGENQGEETGEEVGGEENPGVSHSTLYLEGVDVEDVIRYFNEVALDTEYATGEGNASLIQKWGEKITYRFLGDPTEEDKIVLKELFEQLNQISGFPGIEEAAVGQVPSLQFYFQDRVDFMANFGDFIGYEEADGAAQYWYYTATNVIYTGRIGYRTDIGQELRNSVLLEEVVNLLGFNDTVVREDSIVYQYSSEAQELSKMDWLLLKLMYHADMKPGMNAEACEQVIRTLYY